MNRFKRWLILWLIGDTQVCVNIKISSNKGFELNSYSPSILKNVHYTGNGKGTGVTIE